jgi:hypothetical protein
MSTWYQSNRQRQNQQQYNHGGSVNMSPTQSSYPNNNSNHQDGAMINITSIISSSTASYQPIILKLKEQRHYGFIIEISSIDIPGSEKCN